MNWDHLTSALGGVASVAMAVLALLQRPRVWRWYSDRRILIDENTRLLERCEDTERDNARLSDQLDSTLRVGAFSREELDSIIDRLETVSKNQAENDTFIRGAIPYMAACDAVMIANGLKLPDHVKRPIIPPHIAREGYSY